MPNLGWIKRIYFYYMKGKTFYMSLLRTLAESIYCDRVWVKVHLSFNKVKSRESSLFF